MVVVAVAVAVAVVVVVVVVAVSVLALAVMMCCAGGSGDGGGGWLWWCRWLVALCVGSQGWQAGRRSGRLTAPTLMVLKAAGTPLHNDIPIIPPATLSTHRGAEPA